MTATPKGKLPAEPYRAPGPHGVALAGGWLAACKPRERPPLSKFMAEHARSDDGARIRPFPFQADIADAFTDPETAQLSVRKSSRIGYSTILQCFVAWRIKYDPARTLIYQPTIDDAEKFSRDDLDPVLQWPIVRSVATFKPRHADNQIRAKRYKGGWIQIKGANKPTWNGGSGAIRLTKGGGTITGGVTYSIGAQQNIASLTLNGATFSFAGLTADTGQFVINAIFNGIAYSRVISVKKVRDGSAAFRSEAPFSANSNAASGTGNTTVPQARTVSAIIIAALLAAVIWSFQRAVS